MARGMAFGADRNVHFPMYHGGCLRLRSHFSVEVAPDLIVTPLLFGTPSDASRSAGANGYTLPPAGLVVLHGRGDDQVAFLLDEVAPSLQRFTFAYIYDADRRRLHAASRPEIWMEATQLPAIVREVIAGFDGEYLAQREGELDWVCGEVGRALGEMPTPAEVEAFRAEPEIERRIAEAARRFEENPLRLWEAMFWRGDNYRWELVNGEVPLVGELWSSLAANRTLLQCVADAERSFDERATEDRSWVHCGPMRMRQRGTRVEIRYRVSPADRRAAFMPASRVDGDDAMPSLFGTLLAGGGKGKTEMMHSYVDSVIAVHERHDAVAVARHLAREIHRTTGAEATVKRSSRYWPEAEGDTWKVYIWERDVHVYMPAGRARHAPWDALAGLHLSDDFVFWRWHRERAVSDAGRPG